MAKKNEWKDREGVVYSTNPDFGFQTRGSDEGETLPSAKQLLYVGIDKTGRAGKQVTLITGFIGKADDLEALTKMLKTKCGVGGSCKDGEILIQGDVREKVVNILMQAGYKSKRSN